MFTNLLFKKKSKYKSVPVVIDGIRFASKKEAKYYSQLKMLLLTGKIYELKLQVPFEYKHLDKVIFVYKADFTYFDNDGTYHVVDVKGFRTDVYKLKKKLIEATGVKIEEV